MPSQRVPGSVWRERIEQLQASGLSITAFAEKFSYPVDRLRYWSQRLRREVQSTAFVPVRVHPSAHLASPSAVELRGPSGWSVKLDAGADPVWLAALLSGLR